MDLTDARLKMVSVHVVGNKGTGGELITSKAPLEISEEDKRKIKEPFLSRFTAEAEKYRFHHLASLDYNEVYNYCLQLLAETDTFHEQSVNIAKHLFESSTHPKIKPGELYICLFENCLLNGLYCDALGLFKTETKSNFLDLSVAERDFSLIMREGVELTKFDKACLVFPTRAEEGFEVLIYDSNNRGEEAVFWKETFLSVIPQANEYYQTNQFLNLTKQFITRQVTQDHELSKTDQIDLLNKSVEYFKDQDAFDKSQFEQQVFKDPGIINSFQRFQESYAETNDIDIPDNFDISLQAVKKQARVFKSVLKLDRNFHIYIHGDKDLIEKGYDPATGKKYYKIYYDEET